MDRGSSDENRADLFALLELRDNITKVNSKVDMISTKVASLDSKHYLVIKSLFEIKDVALSDLGGANQLDQLISLHLKHTLDEAMERYKKNIDHHISTPSTVMT